MRFEEALKKYAIPGWLRVSPVDDSINVAEILSGRKYVLKGAVDEVMRFMYMHENHQEYAFKNNSESHLQIALDNLLARGFLKERTENGEDYPVYIKPGKPIFGADSSLEMVAAGDLVFFGAPTNFGNRNVVGTIWAPDELRTLSDTYGLAHASITLDSMDVVLGFGPKPASGDAPRDAVHKKQCAIHDVGNVLTHMNLTTSFIVDRIKGAADPILQRGAIPFMIGGDHLVTLGVLRSLSEVYETFDVVHIDAHTDTYARSIDYMITDGMDPHHGNFMRIALDEIGQIGHVYQYGIRGLGNMTQRESDRQTIHWIYETRQLASSRKPLKISDRPVYLTIDIDVLDPSVAPGTGALLPNGLSFSELATLLHNVILGNNVIGVDIVEVDVKQDTKELTKVVALEAIAFIMACLRVKKSQ